MHFPIVVFFGDQSGKSMLGEQCQFRLTGKVKPSALLGSLVAASQHWVEPVCLYEATGGVLLCAEGVI